MADELRMHANSHIDALYLRSRGFSLIELVVVVTLVGILSAFAIPRFTRLENQVRASQVVALGATLRNAAETAHAQYLDSGASLSFATIAGKAVKLANGYPDASANGIRLAITDSSDFVTSWTLTSVTYSKTDAPSVARCAVTYHASPAATTAATTAAMTIDLKTSGC